MNPNTKASQTLRSKRKAAGLQEVRGIWARKSAHVAIKAWAQWLSDYNPKQRCELKEIFLDRSDIDSVVEP